MDRALNETNTSGPAHWNSSFQQACHLNLVPSARLLSSRWLWGSQEDSWRGICAARRKVHEEAPVKLVEGSRAVKQIVLNSQNESTDIAVLGVNANFKLLRNTWKGNLRKETLDFEAKDVTISPELLQKQRAQLHLAVEKAQYQLRHKFKDKRLIGGALVHSSSYLTGHRTSQLLAWIGDSLLYVFTSRQLIETYPDEEPSSWNEARRILQGRVLLSRGCKRLRLDELIVTGQQVKNTDLGMGTLGEILEATLGAVYLDGGLRCARNLYGALFKLPEIIEDITDDFSPFKETVEKRDKFSPRNLRHWTRETAGTWEPFMKRSKALQESMLAGIPMYPETQLSHEMDVVVNKFDWKKLQKRSGAVIEDRRFFLPIFMHRSVHPGGGILIDASTLAGNALRQGSKLTMIGDTVLRHAFTEYLAGTNSGVSMSCLNEERMKLTSRRHIAEITSKLKLHEFVILGGSLKQTHFLQTTRSLGDVFVRLVGAVCLEQGLSKACRYVISCYQKSNGDYSLENEVLEP